jgi:hypothetical protein
VSSQSSLALVWLASRSVVASTDDVVDDTVAFVLAVVGGLAAIVLVATVFWAFLASLPVVPFTCPGCEIVKDMYSFWHSQRVVSWKGPKVLGPGSWPNQEEVNLCLYI